MADDANAAPPNPVPQPKTKHGDGSHRGRVLRKGMIEVESVMGTRDFYPEDMRRRQWLFAHFREIARQHCFEEYDAPIVESEELYIRKAASNLSGTFGGEDITRQMYNFQDKDGYKVALRPEMTPSLARMVLKKAKTLVQPIKWFAIPQCWRYETVQIGRKREHYQWNMDIVGVSSEEKVAAEVELLTCIVALFKRVGLTAQDVGLKVNSRKILQEVLEPLGVSSEQFAPVCIVVDKLDKLTPQQVRDELLSLNLSPTVIETIHNTLKLKDVEAISQVLGEDNPAVKELRLFFKLAQAYGISEWLTFDASVVRGLAYYTGIVFEGFDRANQFRAICGGGRYDKLMSKFGGQDQPCCGFGLGDCVLMNLLESKNLVPGLEPVVQFLVCPFDETLQELSCRIAAELRASPTNPRVDLYLGSGGRRAFDYANKIGAQCMIFVAPDEVAKGQVRVKNLRVQRTKEEMKEDKGYNVNLTEILSLCS